MSEALRGKQDESEAVQDGGQHESHHEGEAEHPLGGNGFTDGVLGLLNPGW